MKEILEVIAKYLVDDQDALSVRESEKDGTATYELIVAPGDMGKVIGKQGRIAKAIRSVVKSAASHKNVRVNVEIISTDELAAK